LKRIFCDRGNTYSTPGLRFSSDGKTLAYARGGQFMCLFDCENGKEKWHAEKSGFPDEFGALCQFTPDGSELAFTEGETLGFRNTENGVITHSYPVNRPKLLSTDCETYVRVEEKKAIVLGDVRTGKTLLRIEVESFHDGIRNGIALSPNNSAIAVVHANKEIQIRDLPRGTIRTTIALPESARYQITPGKEFYWAYRLKFSRDGGTLMLGTAGGTVHCFNSTTGAELAVLVKPKLPNPQANVITGCEILPGGQTLVATGNDGLIRLWDLQTDKETTKPEGYVGLVRADLSADGKFVAVGDLSGKVDLWEGATGKLVRTIRESGPGITNLKFSPNARLLAAGQSNGIVKLWEVPSGNDIKDLQGDGGEIWMYAHTLLFSPDGRSLYVNDYPRRSTLWNIGSGEKIWTARDDFGAAFLPDGKSILASRVGPVAVRMNAGTGAEERRIVFKSDLSDGMGKIRPIAVTSDGRIATVVDMRGTIALSDLNGNEIRKFKNPEVPKAVLPFPERGRDVSVISISANAHWFAVGGGFDEVVRIYEVLTGEECYQFVGNTAGVTNLSFHPNGRSLLSASKDGQVLMWNLKPKSGSPGSVETFWSDLASSNFKKAYTAIWEFPSDPRGVEFLCQKLTPAPALDAEKTARWIADLDSKDFRVRETANKSLSALGSTVVPVLEAALSKTQSAEAQSKLKTLVEDLKKGPDNSDEIRLLRALCALELTESPAARKHIQVLAKGAPGARLTEEAKASLARLDKK
jgi:WD40 repeat protein